MADQPTIIESNLPQFPPHLPTVTMYREQLARFRHDYEQLAEFAALVIGKDLKKLCMADFGVWLTHQPQDVLIRAPRWMLDLALMMTPTDEDGDDA